MILIGSRVLPVIVNLTHLTAYENLDWGGIQLRMPYILQGIKHASLQINPFDTNESNRRRKESSGTDDSSVLPKMRRA